MTMALNRAMTRHDLVAIVINSVVGAGVLGLPGRMFAALGDYSVIAWMLCAAVMGLIALCFAEVASRFTTTGGVYLYARSAFGEKVGFLVGWLAWVSRLFSLATICNLVMTYAGGLDARFTQPIVRVAGITAVFALLTVPLVVGIQRSTFVNNLLTAFKLALFGSFTLMLFWFDSGINDVPRPAPSAGDWQTAMLQMSFAFIGVESVMINAGEMRDPARDGPFALAAGLVVIASLYIAIQIACIGTVPHLASSERPLIDAATLTFGPLAGRLVNVGGLVCMIGTMYAVMLTGSRLPFALGECGQLPPILSAVNRRFSTPVVAIALTSGAAWTLTLYTTFMGALTVTAMTRLVGYVTTCVALVVLRRRGPPARFRVRVGRSIACVAAAACLWLMSATSGPQLVSVLLIALLGFIANWLSRRARGNQRETSANTP